MKQGTQRNTKGRAHLDPHAQETLGERIYRLRHERDITLRALSRSAEISAPYLSDIEHDRRRPTDAVLTKLAVGLHVVPAVLESQVLTRDTLHRLNKDPELVALLRLVMADRHCRCLVLDAAGLVAAKKARR
jgi:transcriptional regulator with XRE-family HTH domain